MKRLLRASTFVLLTVGGVCLSVVAVRASTECERFIRVVHQKAKHHKVSAETAARWTAWNKEHPNYRPHRRLTPKETWEKVNFACQVPLIEKTADLTLPTLELPPLELPPDLFPPETPVVVARNETPVFQQEPPTDMLVPPTYNPEVPTIFGPAFPSTPSVLPPAVPSPVPEPRSLVLLATSLASLLSLLVLRRSKAVRV